MTAMIATFRGFISSYKVMNNRKLLSYTPDVRQALTFGSYQEAERFIAPHAEYWKATKARAPYFAILCGAAAPLPSPVDQAASIPPLHSGAFIEPDRALLLQ